jgi:hypothetical protein
VGVVCRNCGAELAGEFCAACGQRAIDPDPTLSEFVHEAAEELLHWDGKLAATFRLLLTRPGQLTREYLAGRRIRFLSPLRLYLTCSVIYFALSAFAPAPQIRITTTAGAIRVGPGAASDTAALAAIDTLADHGRWIGRVWGRHFARAVRQRDELRRVITSTIPKLMFVLVPLFAALVGLVYRSRRWRYPQHLAFALHVHAYLFLALSAMLLRRVVSEPWLITAIVLVCVTAMAIHVARAARAVYGGSRGATIGRTALLGVTYGVSFVLSMGVMFVLIVLLQF